MDTENKEQFTGEISRPVLEPEGELILVAMVLDAVKHGIHPAFAHAWYLCGQIVCLETWANITEEDRSNYMLSLAGSTQIHGIPPTSGPVPDIENVWSAEDVLSEMRNTEPERGKK